MWAILQLVARLRNNPSKHATIGAVFYVGHATTSC
jgi:hypothetical protein